MTVFELALMLSILLCSLVAGFLFAYAIVIMPGLKHLDDKQFIISFQVTDRIIQNNHPIFLLVWLGSAVALIVCAIYGFGKLHGIELLLLMLATLTYIIGVQALTMTIHLPLNNKLQQLDVESMKEAELHLERIAFESRWNRANAIRTLIACVVTALLIILAMRL